MNPYLEYYFLIFNLVGFLQPMKNIVSCLVLIIFSITSFADEVTKNTKIYKVGVSYLNSYPLVSFASLNDKGFGWSVLEAYAKSTGIKFEYVGLPITRLQASLDNGAIDFIFPDHPKWTTFRTARKPNIYSGPIISTISATFVKNNNEALPLEQLTSVAIPFGYTSYTWTSPIEKFGITAVPVKDLKAALESVITGRTQSADVEYNIGKYLIKTHKHLQGLTINPLLPNAHIDYHLSTIHHQNITESITEFVKHNSILVNELRHKYNIKTHFEVY